MQPRNQQVILLKGGGERLLGDMLGLLSAALAGASQVFSSYPHLISFQKVLTFKMITCITFWKSKLAGCRSSHCPRLPPIWVSWDAWSLWCDHHFCTSETFTFTFYESDISKLTFQSFQNFTFRLSPFMFLFWKTWEVDSQNVRKSLEILDQHPLKVEKLVPDALCTNLPGGSLPQPDKQMHLWHPASTKSQLEGYTEHILGMFPFWRNILSLMIMFAWRNNWLIPA